MGYDAVWIKTHEKFILEDNSLVLTEGQVDKNVPINKTCKYVLHNCQYDKYRPIAENCLLLQVFTNDVVERYKNSNNVQKINDYTYVEGGSSKCLDQPWATDLLPHEINFDWAYIPRQMEVNWIGTVGGGIFGNVDKLQPFIKRCTDHNIKFTQYMKKSKEESIKLIQSSILAPAIVGTWQEEKNYIPCRFWKNISYGQMPISNCMILQKEFGHLGIISLDMTEMFNAGMSWVTGNTGQIDKTKEAMKLVRDNHTYVNRINQILELL